jgi:hypothetical protein
MRWLRRALLLISGLLLGPLAVAASGDADVAGDWRHASRESAHLAPSPATTNEAVVQVYAARAFAWRGIFAVHTWISVKPARAPRYTTYEVVGWYAFRGAPALQVHHDAPDRYWFGARPEILAELRGDGAAAAIAAIEQAVAAYPYADRYRTWPGPNSNTFTAFVLRRVPALAANLPPTAIGKDYLPDGALIARPPSGSGLQLSLFGLLGVILSKEEGLEINLLGLAFGVDPKRLALRLPGVGLVGP